MYWSKSFKSGNSLITLHCVRMSYGGIFKQKTTIFATMSVSLEPHGQVPVPRRIVSGFYPAEGFVCNCRVRSLRGTPSRDCTSSRQLCNRVFCQQCKYWSKLSYFIVKGNCVHDVSALFFRIFCRRQCYFIVFFFNCTLEV